MDVAGVDGNASMRVIAIDWSGAKTGARRKIWLAEATSRGLLTLENGRDREETAAHLVSLARRNSAFIVGLDFAFSLPAWFLAERGLTTAHDLWALAKRDGEAWLSKCAPPFWGRPRTKRPIGTDDYHYRRTERGASTGGRRPKSVFQIGGAGAVGTGSLRGMPILRHLRKAGFSIWPFDPPGWPRVIEIYPRFLTGLVTKSSQEDRASYLSREFPDLAGEFASKAASSEDAFDAAISALKMARHADELAALPTISDRRTLLEGLIWYPGFATSSGGGTGGRGHPC